MNFREVTDAIGLEYGLGAQHIAQIAEGKGKKPGQRLLRRIPGHDNRSKLVVPSRTGDAVACCFAPSEDREKANELPEEERKLLLSDHLKRATIPATQVVASYLPVMSLGSFCVLLYVTNNLSKIAYEGQPTSELAEELGISNLPRHLMLLGPGNPKRKGLGLLGFEPNMKDLRVTLPNPSPTGLQLMMLTVSALLQRPAAELRMPKAEAIEALPSPEDIENLSDEDFEYFGTGLTKNTLQLGA